MNCVMVYPYSDSWIVDWFLQLVVQLVSIQFWSALILIKPSEFD